MENRSNVVSFPAAHDRRRSERVERQKDLRNRDLLRLREIEGRQRGKKGLLFAAIGDRISAANATGRMINEAKRCGKSMDEVKKSFADRFGASGRIDRYSMVRPVGLSSLADKERAKKKLMQKVSGYLKLAEILAEAMGRDVDEAKINVLKDTNLWTHSGALAQNNDVDERASHLALMLREMAQSIIRREKLAELFANARRVPGQWDLDAERFRPSTMACLFQQRYENWFEHSEETPPLPSLPLVRMDVAQFHTPTLIETTGVTEQPKDDFDGETHDGCVRLYREIRLCLGPRMGPDDLGAMFESRAHIELQLGTPALCTGLRITPSCDLWVLDADGGHVLLDNEWRRFRFLDEIDGGAYLWPYNPLGNDDDQVEIEHYYNSWTPVNPDYVSHWLDRQVGEYLVSGKGTRPGPREQWYARPSLAHSVEHDLATGAIEAAMAKQVRKVRQALQSREQEWRSRASAETEHFVGLWNADADHKSSE